MIKLSQKNINFLLGLFVIVFAFFVVFGSQLKNLKIDKTAQQQNTNTSVTAVDTNTTKQDVQLPVKSTTNTTTTTSSSTTNSSSSSSSQQTTTTPSGYTLSQISTHNSATSCWSAINGMTYDLTDWVDSHPGGRATILMICGKDGSALFNMQHGHQSGPKNILASYEIGTYNS